MPASGFRVSIVLRGASVFARLKDKLASFEPVFREIIERWTSHNEAKFEQSQGAQASGVALEGTDAFWKPLSDAYRARKEKEGYNDWLMVREGDLLESLTNPDDPSFYEQVVDQSARFGTVLASAQYNWESRPVMFLDQEDQTMIADMFGGWLNDRSPFRAWEPSDAKRMDAEFHAIMAGS